MTLTLDDIVSILNNLDSEDINKRIAAKEEYTERIFPFDVSVYRKIEKEDMKITKKEKERIGEADSIINPVFMAFIYRDMHSKKEKQEAKNNDLIIRYAPFRIYIFPKVSKDVHMKIEFIEEKDIRKLNLHYELENIIPVPLQEDLKDIKICDKDMCYEPQKAAEYIHNVRPEAYGISIVEAEVKKKGFFGSGMDARIRERNYEFYPLEKGSEVLNQYKKIVEERNRFPIVEIMPSFPFFSVFGLRSPQKQEEWLRKYPIDGSGFVIIRVVDVSKDGFPYGTYQIITFAAIIRYQGRDRIDYETRRRIREGFEKGEYNKFVDWLKIYIKNAAAAEKRREGTFINMPSSEALNIIYPPYLRYEVLDSIASLIKYFPVSEDQKKLDEFFKQYF